MNYWELSMSRRESDDHMSVRLRQALTSLEPYLRHLPECEKAESWRGDGYWALRDPKREKIPQGYKEAGQIREWRSHVCGLQGYNGMIDPPCPGCSEQPVIRAAVCTCGLDALREQRVSGDEVLEVVTEALRCVARTDVFGRCALSRGHTGRHVNAASEEFAAVGDSRE